MKTKLGNRVLALFLGGLVALSGCFGRSDLNLGGPSGPETTSPEADAGTTVNCDAPAPLPELPWRRLTRAQVTQSLDVLLSEFAPESGAQISDELAPILERWPSDNRISATGEGHGGFSQLDQAVQQEHVDRLYELAAVLGRELTADVGGRRSEVFGAACAALDSQNCLRDFIEKFGARVLRRPLSRGSTESDVEFYAAAAVAGSEGVTDPAAFADGIALLLNAPEFLYRVELGQGSESGDRPLDAYELANKLALHFWQRPPDAELLAKAEDGTLLDESVYAAQVDRLVEDPRSRVALDDFFFQWLRLQHVPEVGQVPAWVAADDSPGEDSREAMIEDVLSISRYQFEQGGTISDLLTDRTTFTEDPFLAKLYGVTPWEEGSGPLLVASAARTGLITRPAFLATGLVRTRPIMKGVFIRNALLCEVVGSPPANASMTGSPAEPTATTRESIELLTEVPGSSCAGCHSGFLNPLGFATENFDSLGRERSEEIIFDREGEELARRPVNTHSIPQVLSGDLSPSSGAGELTRLLDESRRVHSCLSRQAFRFAFSRLETAEDVCTLQGLEQQAQQNKPMKELWRDVAHLPEFKTRRIVP